MTPQKIERCRVCGNMHLEPILSLGQQYLTGVFPRSTEQELTCGPLELVKCHGENACGLVQLRHTYDLNEMYGVNYGYRSGLNQSMVKHLEAKVRELLAKFPPDDGDLVLDIGSNDGTLLSFYPSTLTPVGMDPTAAKFAEFYKPHVQVIADFFSADTFSAHFGTRKAKIITSIAMFYDLDHPLDFVKEIARTLADDGVWHFEQSYMPVMLQQNAYDTVCHEHLEYYGLQQIQWMMERGGLKILEVELNDVNGGSFAVTAAKSDSRRSFNSSAISQLLEAERSEQLETLVPYEAFRVRVFEHREKLLAMLDRLKREGAVVVGYGASTKGNVILQFCGITKREIPCFAEVNPDKFGCVTPGTHIPIIPEEEAHAMNPDYLLAMPWHFKANLLKREAAYLGRGGKMIFPLPEIEIVGQ
jgi:hypothetical protein